MLSEVADHYDRNIDREADRLLTEAPIEYGITLRILARHIPDGATVADVGVGAGHYALTLAARGCGLHLIDVSRECLEATASRLEPHHTGQILSSSRATAVDLPLADRSCDAVLMLGPLYHLQEIDERRRALFEAVRVLKTDGVVVAAGINRLAYFRDLLRSAKVLTADLSQFHTEFLRNGILPASRAPSLGPAHLTTAAEFRRLMTERFCEIELLGVESFAADLAVAFGCIDPVAQEGWLDLVEATARSDDGLARSDHLLFVGRPL